MVTIEYLNETAKINLCPTCFEIYKASIEQSIKDLLFNPIDDWRDVESNITQMVLITGIYLFSWDGIQGNDNEIFKKFLKKNFGIDWGKNAKIEKMDDGKTIQLSTGKNYLSLTLNDEKTKISLKIDDGRTDELILRTGKEVYKEGSNVAFGEEIDMKAFQEIKVVWGFTKKIDDLYEKGILGDFSHRVLHEAYEVRNKIHDPSIVSPFSEQDLILFHNASLVTHGILQAIQIERGEDISTSLKSISTNLKNGAEELAKQCLL